MESNLIIGLVVAAVIGFFVWSEVTGKKKKAKKASSASSSGGVIRKSKASSGPRHRQKNGGVPTKAELKKLTKNQLIQLAGKKSLKVKVSAKKADVVNEIHDQLEQEDEDENADL